ncbi:hypothetical protein CLU79DRAFT_772295 [Phycomyces nitens]|nr:hypothetical protein CLU79DRAFT_772295 [Phycomyces nitens]
MIDKTHGKVIHDQKYKQFIQWLDSNDFPKTKLDLAEFSNTGRGMMATKPIEAGEVIVSVPRRFLITNKSLVAIYGPHPLSTHQLLALHLVLLCRDKGSWWEPYTTLLPSHFDTMPVKYPKNLQKHLPPSLTEQVAQQKNKIKEDFAMATKFFNDKKQSLNSQEPILYEEYEWAWLCVNTRCIHMNTADATAKGGNMALAPMLDFLNHAWDAKIESKFNVQNQCFEIKTLVPYAPGEQVFINYGPHDNLAILKEYGFVVPDNVFNYILLDDEVWALFDDVESPQGVAIKKEILEGAGYSGDYSIKKGEASFRLLCALRLLALEGVGRPGFDRKVLQWNDVVMGQTERISADNERRVMIMLQSICKQVQESATREVNELKEIMDKSSPDMHPFAVRFLHHTWSETKAIADEMLAEIAEKLPLIV